MTPVVYDGDHPGVRLAATLGDVWMPHGVPVDVPDDVALALAASPEFTIVRAARRRRPGPVVPPGEIPETADPTVEERHG